MNQKLQNRLTGSKGSTGRRNLWEGNLHSSSCSALPASQFKFCEITGHGSMAFLQYSFLKNN